MSIELSGLVDEVESTHEQVTITRHGNPAAVLLAVDDFESLTETAFWLSQPGIAETLAEARAKSPKSGVYDLDDVRRELGL